jgi:dienelactone hydrolase
MKSRSVSYSSIVGLIAWSCVAFGQGTQPADGLPKLPAPSGPFGIGRVGYDWVDQLRTDQYSSDPQAYRELMVYFWYPTSEKSADARGPYLPGAQRMDTLPEIQKRMNREFSRNWATITSGAIFSHAVERAPILRSPKRLPVVVFSHGQGSTGFNYTCLIEDLASWGYVVASIEHTYVASAVWFPDGRVVPRHAENPPAGLSSEQRFNWIVAHAMEEISEGAADVRFVFDRIRSANRNTEQFWLAGRLDLNRIAVMGHSAGGEFAARACQLDSRFKACIDLDGGMVPWAALPDYPDGATLKQPLLFLEAYHPESRMGGTPSELAAYFKKKEEQLQTLRFGSYAVTLTSTGIAHPSFSDIPLLFAGTDGFPETGIVLHNLDLIEKYVREFLGKGLKEKKAPLLDSGNVTVQEATVKRYGR